MLFGRIYIPVPENVRYKVNIAGFLVKSRTIGTAQLMRSDLFCGSDLSGIFFYQVFDGLHPDTFSLRRVEECVFMAGEGSDVFPDFQIVPQRC